MKERPILFSGPMVRALLAGTKTQTRRICKPRKDPDFGCELAPNEIAGDVNMGRKYRLSPYGGPGDHLWVREAWRTESDQYNDLSPSQLGGEETILYEADADWSLNKTVGRSRPSIHMPSWASRITLEITGVRVERLQEISREDVIAEGIEPPRCQKCGYTRGDCHIHMDHHLCGEPTPPHEVVAYRALWEQINGPGSWAINPWVWVVEFRRVTA